MPIPRNIIMFAGGTPEGIATICRAAGITVADLDRADQLLTLEQNCAMMDAAMSVSGDPHLGLHVGERTTASVLGLTGHIMQSSKDVLTALQNLQQFTRTFTRLYDFRIELHGDEAIYFCEPLPVWNDMSPDTARMSVDIAFSGALHILRLLTGKRFRPTRVMYRYIRLADLSEHERILGCRPVFGQQANCLVFPTSEMGTPIVGYNAQLNAQLKDLLDAEVRKQTGGSTFGEKVKEVILRNLQVSFPALETIADALHMTPRTVQRKLQEEETTFRIVSDSVKEEIARNLLANPDLS
ncbi:MAG TPA: AraC family transcriptional regulator ligand-binding domain-containing protein, partial [Flavobacteriales bacterium]|nr:AraC family transcriptional regulator ligand-binding domain-containing protein [Flavobacteriales bacterium]